MGVAYITQSLDKGTLGTSSIMGWQADVGAKGQDFALTSTLLWVGLLIGEPIVNDRPPSTCRAMLTSCQVNQFVRRLPVAKVLAVCMFFWTGVGGSII